MKYSALWSAKVDHITSNSLKVVIHNFHLVHSWILCPIWPTFFLGHWTHVAGTYDYKTKQAKIYINGQIRNQSIGEGQLSRDWGAKAEIGQPGQKALKGSIDEFRIYNYALKPEEIKALVSACKTGAGDDGGGAGQATSDTATVEAPATGKHWGGYMLN